MNYLKLGKIVNTHGLKGEIRIKTTFLDKEYVYKPNTFIYIGKDKIKVKILTHRFHKEYDMVTLESFNKIEDVLPFKGEEAYFLKEDIVLPEDKLLTSDLIGFKVYMNDTELGTIINVINNVKQEILELEPKLLIPYVKEWIKEINIAKKILIINEIGGLIS